MYQTKLLFNSVMGMNVFPVTMAFTIAMPLVFHVDQFISEFWKDIQGMFHRVVFLGSHIGSCRIRFIFFHVVTVFLTMKLLQCFLTMKLLMFLALSFENRHVKNILGTSIHIFNMYPLFLYSALNYMSHVKALGIEFIQFQVWKVKTTLRLRKM